MYLISPDDDPGDEDMVFFVSFKSICHTKGPGAAGHRICPALTCLNKFIIASDKALFSSKRHWCFSYFSTKTYVVVLIRSTLPRHI